MCIGFFNYNSVRLFLSPLIIPVDIKNTHICTNRLREALLMNKIYILKFFSTNVEYYKLSHIFYREIKP